MSAPSFLGALSNLEAEQAVLGCVLFDCATLGEIPDLKPEHFVEPAHARIFARALELVTRGRMAEPIGVHDAMKFDDGLQELGGLRYLVDLVDHAPAATLVAALAVVIRDHATRRALIQFAKETAAAARTMEKSVAEAVGAAETELAQIAQTGAPSSWIDVSDIVTSAISQARLGGERGLSTGLDDLDKMIGGLRAGQLFVVGGRPGMGKSTAGLQLAKAVARQSKAVVFFSMEMAPFDLGLRVACDIAHELKPRSERRYEPSPRYFDAARGQMDDREWHMLEVARDLAGALPIVFDVRPGRTVSEMRSLAGRLFRGFQRRGVEPGVIIVDHLTITRPEQARGGSKVAEVSDISRALAELAKILNVPVVALTQLSREVEKRGEAERRPQLADLRWSGEIEQDARAVALLYRPEYYHARTPEKLGVPDRIELDAVRELERNKLIWIIAKNSNGPTGEIETYCDMARSVIRNRRDDADV